MSAALRLRPLAGLLALGLSSSAIAQSDDWDDWAEESPTQWSGYLEGAYSTRFDRDPLFDDRASRAELKGQVEVSHDLERTQLSAKLDVHADAVDDGLWFDLREAMLSLPVGSRGHARIGRQVLSWGTGDLLFINDRFPKDFEIPLAGGEDLYFKAPSNSLRLDWRFDALSLDLAWTPRFTPDRYIDGQRLGFFDARSGERVGGRDLIDASEPRGGVGGSEWGLRLHRRHEGVEYALYAYRGFDKQPQGADAQGRPSHFRRDSAGFSLRGPVFGGIASFEAGREWAGAELSASPGTVGARVPHKSAVMAAFEKEWRPKLTIGLQLYAERHDAEVGNASPLNGESRRLVSLRVSRQALRDRLNLSAILFHSPNQHDRWLRLTASHRLSDQWLLGASANAFGGSVQRFFGQLEDDSNAGVWVRRQF